MTTISRELVMRAMDAADMWPEDDALHERYNGRAMQGSECFGLACTQGQLLCFFVNLGYLAAVTQAREYSYNDGPDETLVYDLARAVRSDSMGLGTIYYFPGYEIEEEE